VLIGHRPYSAADVTSAYGFPVARVLPVDQRAAGALEAGTHPARIRRSSLVRSIKSMADLLAAWTEPPPVAAAGEPPPAVAGHEPLPVAAREVHRPPTELEALGQRPPPPPRHEPPVRHEQYEPPAPHEQYEQQYQMSPAIRAALAPPPERRP
jgi:hypothetical protein